VLCSPSVARERRSAAALELAILGLLKDADLHGYELKRRLGDQLGFASSVSFGTLYPALARLEAEGLVHAVEVALPRHVPLTGSIGGELAAFRSRSGATRGSRGKKVYAITDAGSARFEQLLGADLRGYDEDRLFSLRLVFAGFLPAEMRLRLLERRRGQLLDRMSRLAGRRGGPDVGGAYARRLMDHDVDMLERDIAWLDRLIAEERSGQLPAAGGRPPSPEPGGGPAPTPPGPIPTGAVSAPTPLEVHQP
jgi:DNA-binding PadR family transcriptional regulator